MPYQPNIPAASDAISQSQVDLQTNFQQLNAGFAIDHNAYDAVNPGQHKKVLFTTVAADPAIVNPAGQLYTKSVTGVIEAFFSNGTTVSQLTGLAASVTANGYQKFANGLILQWGVETGSVSHSTLITYPLAFPANVFMVQATGVLNNGDETAKTVSIRSGSVSVTQFRTQQSSTGIGQIYWFAIGN